MTDRFTQCPFCHTAVPYPAVVCTGCAATAEYGAPGWVAAVILVVGLVAGYRVGSYTYTWLGCVAVAAVWVAGVWAARNVFKGRVNFRRQM